MIYRLRGTVIEAREHFAVVETGGVGFQVRSHRRALAALPPAPAPATFYCYLHVREDALELYGFPAEEELRFFELLNSVGGVGPKSALAILEVADLRELAAAVNEGRPDLLTRASGIGRKTAERIILELKGKIAAPHAGTTVRHMEGDADLSDALAALGYRREDIREALKSVDRKLVSLEERLKAALKILGMRGK